MGNLTNMRLADMDDSHRFNEEYGMMCTEHAGQLTQKLVAEKGISKSQLKKAVQKARKIMYSQM